MTAKDKAKELVEKFKMYDIQVCDLMGSELEGYEEKHYKQCALICIDEMLAFDLRFFDIEFLKEVKQEIEKL